MLFDRFIYIVGEDYHKPQTLERTLNSTATTHINIPIINDEVFELTESFLIYLSMTGGSTSQNYTKVIILDDDGTTCEYQAYSKNYVYCLLLYNFIL